MRHRKPSQAEHLAKQLDAPVESDAAEVDPEVARMVEAARLLHPSVHPRESSRRRIRQQMLDEWDRQHGALVDVDLGENAAIHTTRVEDPHLGEVTMADVEPITPARARQVIDATVEAATEDRSR